MFLRDDLHILLIAFLLSTSTYLKAQNVSHGIYKNEYDALIDFYNNTNGKNWHRNKN